MTRICSFCKGVFHSFRLKRSRCPSCGKPGMMNMNKSLFMSSNNKKPEIVSRNDGERIYIKMNLK
jgi:rRNA maturation endonuclease Nob1